MRYSTSKEKLSQMHQELDKELEMAGLPPKIKTKRDRQELRFVADFDQNKKSTLSNISNKPATYDHEVKEIDIKSKKSEINDLERKLMELEKKMENIQVSSEDEDERPAMVVKERLDFKTKIETKSNEDTARFLIGAAEKERNNTKFTLEYKEVSDDEQEEDSEDQLEIQKAIEKRKAEMKIMKERKESEKDTIREKRDSKEKKSSLIKEDTERKISMELQSALRPKYSTQKSSRSAKSYDKKQAGKKSIGESVASRKSVQKQKKMVRANSRDSFRSGGSIKKENSKNLSREKINRSMERSEKGDELVQRGEEIEVAKQMKRINNLEKQLQHYRRLSKKYKQQLDDYKVMEIQFRELKKNFAKSETIRLQQKKIIDALKSKIGK